MKNKLAILALASGLILNSCMLSSRIISSKEEEYYPPEIVPAWKFKDAFQNHRFGHYYYMCDYYSYPARIGDDFYKLYLQEGGYETDSAEFKEFQKGTYRETEKMGNIDCLEWQDSTLTVVKNGFINYYLIQQLTE